MMVYGQPIVLDASDACWPVLIVWLDGLIIADAHRFDHKNRCRPGPGNRQARIISLTARTSPAQPRVFQGCMESTGKKRWMIRSRR
jgi:hypothetical protein